MNRTTAERGTTMIIAHVTEAVESAVRTAHETIESYDEKTQNEARDSRDFRVIVTALDDLIVAITGALTPVSNLGFNTTGARFGYTESKGLGYETARTTQYLRTRATDLLNPDHKEEVLSAYSNSEVVTALGHLKSVHELLLSAVRYQVMRDLTTLSEGDPDAFLKAAKRVSHWSQGAAVSN